MTLQLDYTCTKAEMEEAQTLFLRQQLGGGSKWRTRLVLFAILAGLVALAWFRFQHEVATRDRPWFLALLVVVFIIFFVFKRFTRRRDQSPVHLEVSDRELVFVGTHGRTSLAWSGFSQCLESPNIFALLDRPKLIVFAIPKRAFPDPAAQDWFRAQAAQLQYLAPPAAPDPDTFLPGRFHAANGIAIALRLSYRDYLDRNITSWRMKGIFLALFVLIIGMTLFSPHQPDAVVPPLKVVLLEIPIFLLMIIIVLPITSFVAWRSEKKYLEPQQIVVNSEGLAFVGDDTGSKILWSTYKYFRESRWSFYIWNPQGSLWLMFPKREFASPADLAQFRELLQTHLKHSRWFYM